MNSKLLHQVFFGVEFNEPKSTLEHWDQAMGRIRALSDRGLTVEEVLLYYRLHKFDQSLVDKVMDRHRSLNPAAQKMSLEEAEKIMNRIVNDEQKFKSDSVTLDQEVKAMTFVTMPNVTPAATASTNNNTNQGASYKGKGSFKKKGDIYCTICNTKGHYYQTCYSYPSVTFKKSALKAKGRCEDCDVIKGADHYCYLYCPCKLCKGKHRWQLCEHKGNK